MPVSAGCPAGCQAPKPQPKPKAKKPHKKVKQHHVENTQCPKGYIYIPIIKVCATIEFPPIPPPVPGGTGPGACGVAG